MFADSVYCPNEDCNELFDYSCEDESAGDGSEHEATCPRCGTRVAFEINYHPCIGNEREVK